MMKRRLKFSLFLIGLASMAAPTASFADGDFLSDEDFFEEDVADAIQVQDPLEFLNRITFRFNDIVYTTLLQPVADLYQFVTPDFIEDGASNVFNNLKYPVRLTGNLLQARFDGAFVETGRFAVNTTVGIGGFFSPADNISFLEPIPKEDVGQALGAWGVSEGPFLILPLMGPSNLRDVIGLVGDRAVYPFSEPFSLTDEKNWDWNWEWEAALSGTEFVVGSPSALYLYKQLKGSAIDPYGAIRDGYTQYRRVAIEE